MIAVERTDFVSVPVQDMERAKRFYSETLGIHSPNLDDGWPEFETGNVSLYLVDPTRVRPGVPAARRAHRAPGPRRRRRARAARGRPGSSSSARSVDTGVCHMAFFQDTEGNALMLHRRYAPAE